MMQRERIYKYSRSSIDAMKIASSNVLQSLFRGMFCLKLSKVDFVSFRFSPDPQQWLKVAYIVLLGRLTESLSAKFWPSM